MPDRFPLPPEAAAVLDALRQACERNDVRAAQEIRARIDSGPYVINLGMCATAVATLVALRRDPATGRRLFEMEEWQTLWTSVRIELLPELQRTVRHGPGLPGALARRPRTRDPLLEVEQRMRAILQRVVHLKSLPRRGAAARRHVEGAQHVQLQQQRARRPLTAEHRAILKLLRAQPRLSAKALFNRLTRAGVPCQWRGFPDRVARLRRRKDQ